MPILDTSFLIRLYEGDESAKALLRDVEREPLIVPPWVVVEFLAGRPGDPADELDALRRAFTLVETSTAWAIAAATFRKELHRRGVRTRVVDFWIATFARLLGTFVITQHVGRFKAFGVDVRSW